MSKFDFNAITGKFDKVNNKAIEIGITDAGT